MKKLRTLSLSWKKTLLIKKTCILNWSETMNLTTDFMPVLINVSRKSCYWHRQSWKFLINYTLAKLVVESFSQKELFWKLGKFHRAHRRWRKTFLKLHVDSQWISKSWTSSRKLPEIFRKFSEQRFGSSMKG